MPEEIETKRDDEAAGHFFLMFIKNPKLTISILVALNIGFGGTLFMKKPKNENIVIEKLEKMGKDIVEIKITGEAIKNSLPEAQRRKAQAQIDLQMAAIEMSQSK